MSSDIILVQFSGAKMETPVTPKKSPSRAEKISDLEEQARKIQTKARELKAQEKIIQNRKLRKADSHKKILLGSVILNLLSRGLIDHELYKTWIINAQLSDRDRNILTIER